MVGIEIMSVVFFIPRQIKFALFIALSFSRKIETPNLDNPRTRRICLVKVAIIGTTFLNLRYRLKMKSDI
jgi:hypothetical protein